MKPTIILGLAVAFLYSCSSNEPATITTDITDKEIPAVFLTNEVDMVYDTLSSSPRETIQLQSVNGPFVFQISAGRMFEYLYVESGTEVTISKSPENRELVISSSHQAEQDLLKEFSKEMQISSAKYSLQEMTVGTEEYFLEQLAKKYEKVTQLVLDRKPKVSPDLVEMLLGRVHADRSLALVMYPQFYKFKNRKEAVLSDAFYAGIEKFDVDNEKLFYFQEVKSAATAIIAKDLVFEDYQSVTDYYGAQYQKIESAVANRKVSELLRFDILGQKIQFGGGTEGFEKEIKEFLSNCVDPSRKSTMQSLQAQWAHLKVGFEAPNFTGFTREGKQLELADLEGKNIYVDVWATWCGPCIAEIPSLKAMEEAYEDENVEFVSVSIDKESDREKWMTFVQDKNLGGTQVMTDNVGRSEISEKYNISGIPRFIMIDSDGRLVDVNAPRPSNKLAFDRMMAGVLK